MDELTIEQPEQEMLACEISDEMLEGAAATKNTAAYTLGACTSVVACPGG